MYKCLKLYYFYKFICKKAVIECKRLLSSDLRYADGRPTLPNPHLLSICSHTFLAFADHIVFDRYTFVETSSKSCPCLQCVY